MDTRTKSDWPRFVRTHEAARLLDLSPRTLEKHRCDGTGPTYRKLGGRVVYALADLEAWIEACARRSTSEPMVAAQHAASADRFRAGGR